MNLKKIFLKQLKKIDKKEIFVFAFLLLIAAIRLLNYSKELPEGKNIILTGKIEKEPLKYESSQLLYVKGFSFYLPLYPEVRYGDTVKITGIVKEGKIKNAKLQELSNSNNFLFKLRNKLTLFFAGSLPEPHSLLVAGMVLGSKSELTKDFWEKLKVTGTAHVVVASGMNVTLIAGFAVNTLIKIVKRRKAVPIAIICLWIYSFLCGLEAPVVRAAIMVSLGLVAQVVGRLYSPQRALLLTAIFMIIFYPVWFRDTGFYLSFFATLSMLTLNKKIFEFLKFVPRFIREDLSTTLSAQVGVFPILYLVFGRISFWAPITNVLILWTVVPITLIGMASSVISFVSDPLARLTVLLTYPLTRWFVFITNLFA